jgi:hypothetical protein
MSRDGFSGAAKELTGRLRPFRFRRGAGVIVLGRGRDEPRKMHVTMYVLEGTAILGIVRTLQNSVVSNQESHSEYLTLTSPVFNPFSPSRRLMERHAARCFDQRLE